ncbi:transglutaminaseTgpA domain-containing protein [Microbacterium sp. NPDC058345]|uniref:transglutaminase family protein n=1 Tax=Microbacterium sp. NPDC058345 TaxID=3346455 RepID=UPI003664BF4E
MAEPRPATDAPRRPRAHPVAVGVFAALVVLVELWPYSGVISPGLWSYVAVVVVIVVAGSGILARLLLRTARAGIRRPVTLLAQLVAVSIACTLLLAGETTVFGLFPTETTVRLVGARLSQSVTEVMTGTAPVPASLPLATLVGLAFAVVAILIDQLFALRQVILTVVLATVVGVMPMIISFGAVNIAWFLLHSVTVLLLFRHAARHDRRAPRESSYIAAASVGAAAIVVALVISPGLPVVVATMPGTGPALTVNADLRLGEDLRRPQNVEVMTLVTSAAQPPYLRIASLSRFDGEVWRPDRGPRQALDAGFGPDDWGDGIEAVEHEVSIRVTGVSSARLPVPYAAERIDGARDGWEAMPVNRTVVSRTADAAGEDYTVTTATATPTLEQIRASSARGVDREEQPTEDLPAIIAETAREVTAQAFSDYDRLIALQDWFRTEFSYSLDAPVDEGFDGTGADAVETFLQERTGYCIHFAGAFALMAQTMDMPVRIIVGYLPGTSTDEKRGDDTVYSITSDQLHAWPEVFFQGIGWVAFEPTATLGVPTAFVAAESEGGSGEAPEAPTPTTGPSTGPTAGATDLDDPRADEPGGGDSLRTLDPTPVLLTVSGVLILLLLPAVVRLLLRAVRFGRARSGDAMAAWRELTATMTDLGLATPDAQTARMRAAELTEERGVPAGDLSVLVQAVERTSYASAASGAGDLASALRQALARLTASVDGRRRVAARLLPGSLFRRG